MDLFSPIKKYHHETLPNVEQCIPSTTHNTEDNMNARNLAELIVYSETEFDNLLRIAIRNAHTKFSRANGRETVYVFPDDSKLVHDTVRETICAD